MPNWKILSFPTLKDTYGANGFLWGQQTTVKVNLHPLTGPRGKWVNIAPYSKFIFELEPWGQVEIPSGVITSADKVYDSQSERYYFTLYVFVYVDCSTGDGKLSLSIYNDVKKAFYSDTRKIAVSVPVHQTIQDAMGFRKAQRDLHYTVIDQGAGFVDDILNLDLGSAVSRFTQAERTDKDLIDTASKSNAVSVSGDGTVDSYMSFCSDLATPRVHAYYSKFTDEFIEDVGRPLCKKRVLNTLNGFTKCKDASIESGLTQAENSAIEAYLNGGFFYE